MKLTTPLYSIMKPILNSMEMISKLKHLLKITPHWLMHKSFKFWYNMKQISPLGRKQHTECTLFTGLVLYSQCNLVQNSATKFQEITAFSLRFCLMVLERTLARVCSSRSRMQCGTGPSNRLCGAFCLVFRSSCILILHYTTTTLIHAFQYNCSLHPVDTYTDTQLSCLGKFN